MSSVKLVLGDCLEVMRDMPDNSISAVVADPPYGLSFMGKKWDYDVPSVAIWRECLRVLKPGGHLLAFAGTRTQHRMAVNIEDAGFEIRDMVTWLYDTNTAAAELINSLNPEQLKLLDATFGRDGLIGWGYGSGFPKSMDIGKQLDRMAGAEREVVGHKPSHRPNRVGGHGQSMSGAYTDALDTVPATEAAQQWDGWGTALKPALEPITVARKPFSGTVAANVLEHGTGGLNIDACRVEGNKPLRVNGDGREGIFGMGSRFSNGTTSRGRWPANLIHDGSEEVTGLFPVTTQKGSSVRNNGVNPYGSERTWSTSETPAQQTVGYTDTGSAARYFYCAKSSKRDRDEGLEGMETRDKYGPAGQWNSHDCFSGKTGDEAWLAKHPNLPKRNFHPTVKPTDLMRYLCRLVTPPGGTILDPFCGSGSTGKAAVMEGFRFVGIELEPEYLEIARRRIAYAQAQMQLPLLELTP